MYSLADAAKATGKSKSTILRAIKKTDGKGISATQDVNGHYQITPDELHRVYPLVSNDALRGASNDAPRNADATPSDAAEIRVLQVKLETAERLATDRQRTIDDLRDRLDKEGEERRRLTNMLTDQREKPPQEATQRRWWPWLAAVAVLLAVALAVVLLRPEAVTAMVAQIT